MQIVIDISEEDYKNCIKYNALKSSIYKAIQRGIPLPKGHGRLIEEERISLSGIHFETELDHAMMIGRLNSAPTIIEADKEQTNE